MDARTLEDWVHRVIESAQREQPSEDSLVELKGKWPEPTFRTAKQLAGLANAARLSDVLWIIGVDEKTGKVHSPDRRDLASWWPQVERCFEPPAPEMRLNLNVTHKHETVVAILFATDRSPYVLAKEDKKLVPWRDGTRTKWAGHRELLRMLLPLTRFPDLETVSGDLTYKAGIKHVLDLRMTLYLWLRDLAGVIVIPAHRVSGTITSGDDFPPVQLTGIKVFGPVTGTAGQARLQGSGAVELEVEAKFPIDPKGTVDLKVHLELPLLGVDRPIKIDEVLRHSRGRAGWRLVRTKRSV